MDSYPRIIRNSTIVGRLGLHRRVKRVKKDGVAYTISIESPGLIRRILAHVPKAFEVCIASMAHEADEDISWTYGHAALLGKYSTLPAARAAVNDYLAHQSSVDLERARVGVKNGPSHVQMRAKIEELHRQFRADEHDNGPD